MSIQTQQIIKMKCLVNKLQKIFIKVSIVKFI